MARTQIEILAEMLSAQAVALSSMAAEMEKRQDDAHAVLLKSNEFMDEVASAAEAPEFPREALDALLARPTFRQYWAVRAASKITGETE